jgi:hypothetical protein
MRTRTTTINVYSFFELSEQAKKNAINKLSDINVDYEWWEFTYEDAKNIGLKITGFDLDRNRHATGQLTLSAAEVAANILKDHGEKCETHHTAQQFIEDFNPLFAEYMDESSEHYENREREEELQDIENDFLKSLLEDYSVILQNEYEYKTSEEAIRETIEANEYEFDEQGNLI